MNAREEHVRTDARSSGADLPNVLVVADHFGYPDGVSHGLTTYFLHVLPELVACGVNVTACFLRDPHPAARQLADRGITPIFLSAGKFDVFVPLRLAAIARQRNCRIIHASQIKATLAARIAARIVDAQTVVHVHDFDPPGPLVQAAQRWFARPSDMGIAVAHAVEAAGVENYCVRAERIRVIHNSVRVDDFRSVTPEARAVLRASLQIPETSAALAMIGRMYIEKGHQNMVRILERIVATYPDVVLLLVGDGPERAACEQLSRTLGIENRIRFLGQRSDIAELLAASDLVMLPSDIEGLPLVGVEALAAGRPVVAFDVGGCGEVVRDGVTGRLVEPANLEAFAAAVVELLRDPAKRAAMSRSAGPFAEEFSVQHHVQQLLSCYREAAASATRARAASVPPNAAASRLHNEPLSTEVANGTRKK